MEVYFDRPAYRWHISDDLNNLAQAELDYNNKVVKRH